MIINSYTLTYDETILVNLLYTTLSSFIILIVGIIVSFIVIKFYKTDNKNILGFGMFFFKCYLYGISIDRSNVW